MSDIATAQGPVGGRPGARVDVAETPAWSLAGGPAFVVAILAIAAFAGSFVLFAQGDSSGNGAFVALGVVLVLAAVAVFTGLAIISPGSTRVVLFFGRYIGTVRRTGLVLTVPLATRRSVSVRVRNFETNELKVNDQEGNPVNIAAIVVWQVADTAKAVFAVQDYGDFVRVQSESALRHVAMSHPYDHPDSRESSLRGATDLVSGEIADEVAARVAIAGVEVIEARISNLAYSPEIAGAMLQRQQAGAIIAARSRIVEGAVSMVKDALSRLEADSVVALDDERKAAMVSNLLVVLCGEARATPVVNTGTLYQ